MTLRVRRRYTQVRNKVTNQIGKVIMRDSNNVYVIWDNQTPQETIEGPAIFARPYSKEFLERI